MVILLGDGSGKRLKEIVKKHNLGRMLCQNWPDLYENEPWGFDNGAWGFLQKGIEFSHYNNDSCEASAKYLVRLNKAMKIEWPPYLAVLPDIVGGGDKSLDVSLSWLGKLPKWSWYLAVQDGMTVSKVIDAIQYVDGIFLGGTDNYKKYAGYWCKIAHHFGKKFHYARAGTLNKLAHAMSIGVDSLDSSFPLWTKDRLFAFIQALSQQTFKDLRVFSPHPEQGTGALVEL